MKNTFTLFFLLLLASSCKESTHRPEVTSVSIQQNVTNDYPLKVFDFNGLKPLLEMQDEKVHIVNFWATWCAPCVKELPYFEQVNSKYNSEGVEVLLVSLDFPNQYDKKLKPFIKKHKLKSNVVALDDTNQDLWIPAINEDWTGALPATLIYNKNKRKFYEGSFTYDELENELKQFLN